MIANSASTGWASELYWFEENAERKKKNAICDVLLLAAAVEENKELLSWVCWRKVYVLPLSFPSSCTIHIHWNLHETFCSSDFHLSKLPSSELLPCRWIKVHMQHWGMYVLRASICPSISLLLNQYQLRCANMQTSSLLVRISLHITIAVRDYLAQRTSRDHIGGGGQVCRVLRMSGMCHHARHAFLAIELQHWKPHCSMEDLIHLEASTSCALQFRNNFKNYSCPAIWGTPKEFLRNESLLRVKCCRQGFHTKMRKKAS